MHIPVLPSSGEYELVGFASHMGPNLGSGHYVAHVKKNGRWVLFNDKKVREAAGRAQRDETRGQGTEVGAPRAGRGAHRSDGSRTSRWVGPFSSQVAESKEPPIDLGYLYLYRRTTPSRPAD